MDARGARRLAPLAAALSLAILTSGIPAAGSQTRTTLDADPGLKIVATIPVSHPFNMAYGFGSLWVSGVGHLARIDPATNEVIADIPMPRTLFGGLITIGSDSVWLSLYVRNVVERIEPSTNEVVATIRIRGPMQPVEAGGFLWIPMHVTNGNPLAKVDLATNQVVDRFPIGNPRNKLDGAQFMTVFDGDIWANVGSLFGIARFDVDSESRTDVIPTLFWPAGEIIAAFGSMWSAEGDCNLVRDADGRAWECWVVRIDPETGVISSAWRMPFPRGLADAFGSLWVSTLRGRIVQLDPSTDEVVSTTRVVGAVHDVIDAGGALWAAVFDQNTVLRLEPP